MKMLLDLTICVWFPVNTTSVFTHVKATFNEKNFVIGVRQRDTTYSYKIYKYSIRNWSLIGFVWDHTFIHCDKFFYNYNTGKLN